MRVSLLAAGLAASLLTLAACKRTEPAAAPADAAPPAAAATPAKDAGTHDNLNAVAWVQTSVEYRAITMQTFRAAADHLDVALKEKNWDALVPGERGNAAAGLKPAVVMDVDETVLDNSPYQARLIRDGKEYDEISWDQWVAEKKAKPLPGVVDFAKAAAAKGVTILYISNRAVHLKEATLANLREAGLPVADERVPRPGHGAGRLRAERLREELPPPPGGTAVPRADAVRRPDRRLRPSGSQHA